MTTFEFDVVYSEPQVRNAVGAYFRHMVRRHFTWKVVVAEAVFLAVMMWAYARRVGWALGAIVLSVLVEALFLLLLYRSLLRNSLDKYHEMGVHGAHVVADDLTFTVRSDIGMSQLPWRMLADVLETPETLVVVMRNRSMFGIPTSGVSPDALAFIRQQIGTGHGAA